MENLKSKTNPLLSLITYFPTSVKNELFFNHFIKHNLRVKIREGTKLAHLFRLGTHTIK